jgi:hypothetical protein
MSSVLRSDEVQSGARAPAGGRPDFYVVGGGGNRQCTLMDPIQSFSQKQREMFARLLQEARKREEAKSGSESDDDQVEAEVVPRLAEEKGASKLIAKVRRLRQDLDDAEEALDDLGFRYDGDGIALQYDAPKALRESLEDAKRTARKERDAALRKYDLAILGVWAAENAEDAKKIVEKIF